MTQLSFYVIFAFQQKKCGKSETKLDYDEKLDFLDA